MVGRKTFRNLGERVRNAMNIRRGGGYRNLARSGQNPHHARAISASRSTTAWAVAIVVAMIAAVTVMFVPSPAAQAAGTTVVDPNTTGTWENFTNPDGVTSTQNVGRIWTDKSVFDKDYEFGGSEDLSGQKVNKANDSDFLVSLSALSSTSNLKTTTTTTTPLDIVLVLDVSGSMDDSMGTTYTYTEAYPRGTQGTYYIQVNGEWIQVQYHDPGRFDSDPEGWRYRSGGSLFNPQYTYVEPKTSANDNDSEHIQFYTRQQRNADKIDALKTAANQFISSVGDMNEGITDEADQHRIAIVKYAGDRYNNSIGDDTYEDGRYDYNYTQVVSDFSSNTAGLENDIDGLEAAGATAADYGLTMAQRVLNGGQYGGYGSANYVGARDDAQKVVIFFTDGEPNHSSGWSDSVAATSVNLAHDMKAAETTIYTIGVVNGANPDENPSDRNASDLNKYLHAVSSNYKNATATNWRGEADWDDLNLGDRTQKDGEDANYYYAASDSEQLNQVFDDITSSITEGLGSGSPIEETTSQGNTNPGNLTFEDQLGSYMQVTGTGAGTDKIQLAYGDRIYTSESKTTEGNTDTYHFANQTVGGNEVYGQANLADIVVTVERSTDLSAGDKITVTLPASLLPMRHYDVDTDNSTMTVDAAYPVRLFYGVTLKADAKTALEDASGDTYQGILNDVEVSEDGTLDFYSNAFAEDTANGLTTATFTPSEGNKFYYYTEDTPLYVDESCQTRATNNNIGRYGTVYYADTYWKTENGTTSETTTGVAVSRNGSDFRKIQYDRQGQAYIPAHTQRGDRPSTLVSNKEDFEGGNVTGTASSVLVPSWNDDGTVSQALGNNGKFSYPAPGDLEIKKEVDWGNASDATKTSKNIFTFQVSLNDSTGAALTGTYNYAVYGASADPVRTGTISNNGTVSITPDEHVLITGLPAGVTYTVTEQGANSNGFTTTDSSTGENANTTDGKVEGAIVGGGQQSVAFKNTYHAAPVNLNTKATLQVQKNLTGRDWRATDEFTFEIDGLANTATGETAPEPAQTTVTVTDETPDYTAAFGDITFTKPGEYRYAITEHNDINPIDGIDYSAARYRAIVTVTDNGTGNLVVDSVTIEQRSNDDGVAPEQQPTITNNTVVFTNNYDVNNGTTNIDGTKNYTDTTGGNPIDADKFTFQLKAVGGFDTATVSADDYTIDAADVPMPAGADENHAVTTTNTGYGFGFPTISYDGNDVGKTFVYEVTELAGTESGMSYDTKTTHTVQVAVSEVEDPEHPGQTIIVATPDMTPEEVVFTNTYDPTNAALEGEDAIHGTKTLTGRDMLEGETFYFQLTQTGGPATVDPDDGDAYVTVLQNPETATVAAGDDDMAFNFSDLTFPQTGEYTFTVNEVAADGTEPVDGSGLTYDKNICTVTVNVTDNKQGALVADVTYANQGHDETDQAVFTNTYEASVDYGANGAGGITVTKQILDRTMAEGDYTFTITGEGEAADLVTDADASFTNTAAAVDGTVTMDKLQSLKFDQDDAGKTFTFTVDEADPAEGQAIAGVAYDKSQYKVEIEVVDNGNGTMHTVTTITKTMDAAGEPMNEVVVDHTNSDADGYTVPTFGFVNDYNPGSVTIGEDAGNPIQVTKTVAGAPSPADVNYSFTLKLTSDNKAGISEGLTQEGDAWVSHVSTSGVINQDATDGTQDDSQTVTFGNITFTEPGTYTFEVAEDALAADEGWTFDTTPETVTVVVSDLNEDNQYDGDLHIASVTGSPVKVTNRYDPESVVVGGDGAQQQITVKKTVTGADSESDFDFDIAAVDEDDPKWNNVEAVDAMFDTQAHITDGVSQTQSKTATFGAIKFNAEGTYQFTVTESGAAEFNASADRKGWTYDEHTVTVTVTVDDTDYDGQLEASVSYDNSKATTEADKAEQSAAAFTNAYNATEITTGDDAQTGIQVTKKVTGHDAIEAFEFSLELAQGQDDSHVFEGSGDGKTAFDGMTLTTSKDIKAGATETKTFDGITFTAAGDYTFVIDETTEKTDEGWTYDTDTAEVTVHVKDNGEGALYIESIEDNNPEFENVYQLQPAKFRAARFQLQGNKVLDGRNWETGDEFTFTLTAGRGDNVDGTQMADGEVAATMPDSTSDTIRPADGDGSKVTDNSAQFTFTDERFPGEEIVPGQDADDTFIYTKPGTYRYLIRETNPNVSSPGSGILGVSYDQTVYRLTVVVTDNGDGTMNAEGSYTKRNADGTWADLAGSNEVTFTNKYSSDEVDITFNAFKVLEDRDQNMKDGEFTFHMEFAGWAANDVNADPNDDSAWTMDDTTKAPAAAADTGNIIRGDVTFGEMPFTKDNVGYTYRYKITENAGTVPGVTYDKSVHYVTAKVTSVSTPDDPQDPDGAYTEHVRVETSGEAEWNEQTGTAPTSGAIFTNTYEAGAATGVPANFKLTKQFTGHEWTDDYGFEFTLAAQDSELADGTPVDAADVPMPASATKTVNAPDKEGGDTATFDFGGIRYDKAGTYRYTVTETHAGETLDGITYDAQPATVTVTVTEGKDPTGALTGQLVATATVTNGDFVNTYQTSATYNASGVGGLDITKQVTNHAMTDGQFSFTITATSGNADAAAKKLGIQDGTTATVESTQAEAGVATSVKVNPFETVTFDKSDDGVTYTYTITENGKTGEGDYKNYVLDDSTYTVQIKPVDNGDGTMTVTTQVSDGAGYTEMTTDQRATVPFVNSYQADPTTVGAEGAATIEGTKTLKNDILADGQFTFQVKSGDVVVATGTNAANGTITFGDITYTTENLAAAATVDGSDKVGKATVQTTDAGTVYTFNYTVSEVEPAADSGVTASTAAQNITVTVTDDGNGTLIPQVTYGDGDPLAFENVYGGDAEFPLDIAGTKEIVGAQDGLNVPVLETGDYEFTIVGNPAQDGTPAPMPAATTVANDASGNVTFEDIVYTMENTFGNAPATGIVTLTAGRTQVFTYTISESGSVDGVTNEQGTKTVEVTVTDLGGGKLEAEVTSVKTEEGADFAFTNTYDVKPTTSSLTGKGGFEITKKLDSATDRKLTKNDFSFQLTSGGDVVATATNDADGTVSFDGITFTKPGTYHYVLSEVNDGKPGVDYDATNYNVTATVVDNGNGTLEVTWDMPQAVDNAVTFTNVYDPADATVTLGAGKTFAGADLKDGQFTFQLAGEDESTPMPEDAKDDVSTATNDENGSIVFGTIAYDKPGTYKYTVSEVNDEQDGVTYDDTTYEVTVTVTDDTATGTLKAAVSYGDADAMVFSNLYKKPVEPAKPTIPKTGIDVIIPGVAGLILLLGAGGVYAFKRRRRS